MTKKELTIKAFFSMTNESYCMTVYRYHSKMQKRYGRAVKGHKARGRQDLKKTAKAFNMSIGRISGLISLAKARIEERIDIRPEIQVGSLGGYRA